MANFKVFISETFDNYLSGPSDIIRKQRIAKEVFEMLQSAYAPIGGIKGNGFRSEDDMVKNIHMWKVFKKDGKIRAVAMYKDSSGRKRVAIASDGTPDGKAGLAKIVREDILTGRAFAEISGGSLGFLKKQIGDLSPFAKTPDEVREILAGEEILSPVDEDDVELLKHPELEEFFYQREIGGKWHTKIMVGVPFQEFY